MSGEVVDPTTGVKFPLFQTFWDGVRCKSLGVGPRLKKVAFVNVKVYSVTLYVDEAAARADLQQAQQAGKLGSDEGVCAALEAGPYTKAFQMQLVRNVTGAQFSEAFDEAIRPRMRGEEGPLDAFKSYFSDKHLDNGTNVVLLWRQPGDLDLLICPPGAPLADFSQAKAETSIPSQRLCQGIWGNYLDPSTPSPVGRTNWIAGARALLATS